MAKRPGDRYPSAGDLGRHALAAGAGHEVREPERAVGVGAAAPGVSSQTMIAVAPRRRRRWLAAVVAVPVAVAAAFVGAKALEPEPPTSSAPSPTATTPPSGPEVREIRLGGRPVSLAAAGDRVWALVGTRTRLVSISPASGRAQRVAGLPRGGEELEVSGADMYAAFDRPPQVLRLDSRTGRTEATSQVFAGPTRRVEVGLGSVWVTERSTDENQPDHLLRLDPETLETEMRVPMLHGARDVSTGGGAVWVASRDRQEVLRIDPETGAVLGGLGVGNTPTEIAYGRRSLWSASDDDTVTRTPLSTKQKVEISVPGKPAGIEIRGRDVWVTALATNQLYRIDARRNEVVGGAIPVCVNPGLLEVTATDVWTACLGNRSVAQVTYR
jgi:streptogramin lyase